MLLVGLGVGGWGLGPDIGGWQVGGWELDVVCSDIHVDAEIRTLLTDSKVPPNMIIHSPLMHWPSLQHGLGGWGLGLGIGNPSMLMKLYNSKATNKMLKSLVRCLWTITVPGGWLT